MKQLIILTIIITFALSVRPVLSRASDYQTVEPGTGIRDTAHDLRRIGGDKGWSYRSQYQEMFNRHSMMTIRGVVSSVERFIPLGAQSEGIRLKLKTEKEDFSVHLGPVAFMQGRYPTIEKGDNIKVEGSRAMFYGGYFIMAVEVQKDDAVLTLRDINGVPLWDDGTIDTKDGS